MSEKPKRPKDINQLAKFIVDKTANHPPQAVLKAKKQNKSYLKNKTNKK